MLRRQMSASTNAFYGRCVYALKITNMTEHALGVAIANDPNLIPEIRNNREPREASLAKYRLKLEAVIDNEKGREAVQPLPPSHAV